MVRGQMRVERRYNSQKCVDPLSRSLHFSRLPGPFSRQKFMKLNVFAVLALGGLPGGLSHGALILTTSNEIGTGGASFTPTYQASSTDVINGRTASASTTASAFQTAGSTGLSALTDGIIPTLGAPGAAANPGLATGTTGASVTYSLGGATDVTSVSVFGAWTDNTHDRSRFALAYTTSATLFGAAFVNLGSWQFNPVVGSGLQSATKATVSDDGGLPIGPRARFLRITFPGQENTYGGYSEIDVVGTASAPIPEPTSVGLFGLGVLALIAKRRR